MKDRGARRLHYEAVGPRHGVRAGVAVVAFRRGLAGGRKPQHAGNNDDAPQDAHGEGLTPPDGAKVARTSSGAPVTAP